MRFVMVMVMVALALTGCATTMAPPDPINITGLWTGSWQGHGVFYIQREDVAYARFLQRGDGAGSGRFWIDGSLASESVPFSIRMAGLDGVPVFFDISGNTVTLRHQNGGEALAEFSVTGDRMIGHPIDTEYPARIILDRVVAAAAPPAIAAPAPPPPPPTAAPAPPAVAEPVPPPPPRLPSPKEFAPTDALKSVYFDFDRSEIRPSEIPVLEGNARWLQANREALLLIEGHCDERGTDAYNLALGDRRAKAVRDYLVAQGVAADRITTLSYGEERPVCTESNESCWQQNRRAVFVIKAQ